MSDTTQTNAMAEIALALAMGFFSIMVLTMVSMGSGLVVQKVDPPLKDDPITIEKTSEQPQEPQPNGAQKNVAPEHLVIFHKGQFLDHQLKPVSLSDVSAREKVVLAVSPNLSMSHTMKARSQIKSAEITVVVLNEKWLSALQEANL